MIRTFCDATGTEITNINGCVEVVYTLMGPDGPQQERLILCPEAGARVIDAIESVRTPQDTVRTLFGGKTIKEMAEDDGA